ncbi:MAG: UxaA family hydrolase [Gracilibacteraceae bacterium]|jgi:altronate dehydratase large subunit|nr:UxaA family hydrolase [Gracilibacteraceae bacterium]
MKTDLIANLTANGAVFGANETFWGYQRENGQVGARNHLAIIPASVCAAVTAARIAAIVKGAVAIPNQHGCCQVGADFQQTKRTLIGLGQNPNVGAALVIGLGCENIDAAEVAAAIAGAGKPTDYLVIQACGGTLSATAEGARRAALLARDLSACRRTPCPVSSLVLGVECGASDFTSGLASNPAVGFASDLLVQAGGVSMLSETTEFIGAEHILANRAVSPAVGQKLLAIVRNCEQRSLAERVDLRGSQPTPGNIAGGLTSIEEKSLGCVHKAGAAPIQDVLSYAEAPAGKGLFVMDTPGQDVDSVTGMTAGGATIILFTTGLGTPTGSPLAPVLKISGNADTCVKMKDNIDIDVSAIIRGESSIVESGQEIFWEMLRAASGRFTKAESLGHCEFGIYKTGPTF